VRLREFARTNQLLRKLGVYALKRNRVFRSHAGQRWYGRYIERQMARLEKRPPFVHIETTNVCNARCTMCSYPIMQRQKGYMSDEIYAKTLEDCVDLGVRDVNLQFLGEPLLDRKICERVRAAKQSGFRVQMVTNASTLDESMGRGLLAAGLDELRISMDGFAESTYEGIRVGLKFERVKQNILGFLELSSRCNGSKPRIVMTFVGLPENQNESREFSDFWRGKVDLVLITQARDWAGQLPLPQLGATYTTKLPLPPCNHLWEEMIVLYDGRVTVCCESYDGQILVGNVAKHSLKDIWVGPEYQRLRNLHREGRACQIPHCSTCKYYAIW
jgi:radical SAM protein with 4Fe4S-binding SPASM domain